MRNALLPRFWRSKWAAVDLSEVIAIDVRKGFTYVYTAHHRMELPFGGGDRDTIDTAGAIQAKSLVDAWEAWQLS